jgi:hypothetical protein
MLTMGKTVDCRGEDCGVTGWGAGQSVSRVDREQDVDHHAHTRGARFVICFRDTCRRYKSVGKGSK